VACGCGAPRGASPPEPRTQLLRLPMSLIPAFVPLPFPFVSFVVPFVPFVVPSKWFVAIRKPRS
jgi:hypothetical protein